MPAKFDLTTADPLFGVPVIGHALNYDQLIAGYLADLLTDPNSEAARIAREKGAIHSWQARNDIAEPVKIGAEVLAGLIPDLAVGALTGGIGLPAILGKYGTKIAKAGGLVGKLGKSEHALASARVLEPVADATFSGLEKVLKKTPGVKQLLAPAVEGVAHGEVNRVADALQALQRSGMGGFTHGDVADAIENLNAGVITAEEFGRAFKIAKPEAEALGRLGKSVDTVKLAKSAPDMDKFSIGALADYYDTIKPKKGAPTAFDSILKPYRETIGLMKQGMLSGPTFVQNAIDIAGKTGLEMGPGGWKKLYDALKVTWKDADTAIPEVQHLMGGPEVLQELGAGKSVIEAITGVKGDKGLPAASNKLLALIGGATGALSGNPLGIAFNAAQLVGMKYGFKFNTKTMGALESMARQVHFLDGVGKYFTLATPRFFKPTVRDAALREIDDLAEAAGKKTELTDFISNKQFLVTPEEVGDEARRLMGVNPSSNRIEELWREVHKEAKDAGVAYSNSINFDYTNDTKLTKFLRDWSPFPVWPIHNIPYYAQKAMTYPMIPAVIGSTAAKAKEAKDYYGLPSRFNDKVPLADIGPGTVFVDPMTPLSIAGQFTEPPARFSDAPATPADTLLDALSYVGLGPNPLIGNALQATGLANRGREVGDFIPWTRLTRALGQATTGQGYDPEAILRAPLEGIRAQVAPDAVPESTYQEYLVRKKLAEMALAKTGKPWDQSTDYSAAMAAGASNPLWQEAQKAVGLEQAATFAARRLTGVAPSYLPDEEAAIRNAKARMGGIPQGATSATYESLQKSFPTAFGYQGIYGSQQLVELQTKLNVFFELKTTAARNKYLEANPDVKMYLDFSSAAKKNGQDNSPAAYVQYIQGKTR